METKQYSKAKRISLLVGIPLAVLLTPIAVLRLHVLMIIVILAQKNRYSVIYWGLQKTHHLMPQGKRMM